MITLRRTAAGVSALAILTGLGCGSAPAAEPAAAELEQGGGGAITLWTERLELFFEHPPLVAGAPGEPWAIHLTDLEDFQPVTAGELTLRFDTPGGDEQADVTPAPARPGIYTPAPAFTEAGMYDLVMELRGPGIDEEIWVGPVQVFASVDELPMLPVEDPVGITFLKEQQWPIGLATVPAGERVVRPGVPVAGEVIAAPDRLAEIAAPVDGILRWDRNGNAPAEGARVARGTPLIRLSPVGGDDAYATLVSRAELLEREVARAERLVAAEAVPARRLDEARIELDAVRAQLEALDASPGEGHTLTLSSPITGTVVARTFTVGQRVAAGDPLLTVLDARRVRLRFHLPASSAALAGAITAATYSPEGSAEVYRTDRVLSVGAALDPVRRTLPVTLEADNPDGVLKPGMLVKGQLLLSDPEPALAVPAEAVMDENGMLVAYVQIGGETIERRAVTIGDTDGQWTVVLSGIRPGERVVTNGAFQVRLASLNTSEISDHGHVH